MTHLSVLLVGVLLSLSGHTAHAVTCGCTCVQPTGSVGYTATAFIEADGFDCGEKPVCVDGVSSTVQVACYKCGNTALDCVIATDDMAVYTAAAAIVSDASTFCSGGNSKCGQQNCDGSSLTVLPFGTPARFPNFNEVDGESEQSCPSNMRGVSNFATYTVTLGSGCPTCEAEAKCDGLAALTCEIIPGGCVPESSGVTCNDPPGKCDADNEPAGGCECSFCSAGNDFPAPVTAP